jgi:hypothetical protein
MGWVVGVRPAGGVGVRGGGQAGEVPVEVAVAPVMSSSSCCEPFVEAGGTRRTSLRTDSGLDSDVGGLLSLVCWSEVYLQL